MRKDVIIPALGWIAAGIISIIVWAIKTSSEICYCSNIPANTPISQVRHMCSCTGSANLLYIGVFVIILGFVLIVVSNKLGKIIDMKYAKKPK